MQTGTYSVTNISMDSMAGFVEEFLAGSEFQRLVAGHAVVYAFETWFQGSNSHLLQCIVLAPMGSDAVAATYVSGGAGITMLSAALNQMPFLPLSTAERLRSVFEQGHPSLERFDRELRMHADSHGWSVHADFRHGSSEEDFGEAHRRRMADSSRCPACGVETADAPRCPSCGLMLGHGQ